MSSTYGEQLKLSIFGQSHGPAIGMTLDDIPAGLPVDFEQLQSFLNRRAPGQADFTTARKEEDTPQFLSGIVNGYTCGAPICATIPNTDIRSADYENRKNCPRPGHADYPAQIKYRGFQDVAGAGHFSGRLTAPLCIAGGLCKQWLAIKGIEIGAHILTLAGIADEPVELDWLNPNLEAIGKDFPVVNPQAGRQMQAEISLAQQNKDSVGGVVECFVTGLPAGLGSPIFGGIESKLAQIIYGIPAIKGLDFGSGFCGSYMTGSQNNDAYTVKDGTVQTLTNNAGGILGGLTTGMPLIFSVSVKPTPSIGAPQQSVKLDTMENQVLTVSGRHDPCIVPRVVPVVEAAAAIALMDICLKDGIFSEVSNGIAELTRTD